MAGTKAVNFALLFHTEENENRTQRTSKKKSTQSHLVAQAVSLFVYGGREGPITIQLPITPSFENTAAGMETIWSQKHKHKSKHSTKSRSWCKKINKQKCYKKKKNIYLIIKYTGNKTDTTQENTCKENNIQTHYNYTNMTLRVWLANKNELDIADTNTKQPLNNAGFTSMDDPSAFADGSLLYAEWRNEVRKATNCLCTRTQWLCFNSGNLL